MNPGLILGCCSSDRAQPPVASGDVLVARSPAWTICEPNNRQGEHVKAGGFSMKTTAASVHFGVPPAFEFPRLMRQDGTDRRHAHAILVFEEPVRGLVLVGAGRYRWYGVCRPLQMEARL